MARNNDRERGQPNYWLIDSPAAEPLNGLLAEIRRLSAACASVVPSARDYAHARVADLINYLLQVNEHSDGLAAG